MKALKNHEVPYLRMTRRYDSKPYIRQSYPKRVISSLFCVQFVIYACKNKRRRYFAVITTRMTTVCIQGRRVRTKIIWRTHSEKHVRRMRLGNPNEAAKIFAKIAFSFRGVRWETCPQKRYQCKLYQCRLVQITRVSAVDSPATREQTRKTSAVHEKHDPRLVINSRSQRTHTDNETCPPTPECSSAHAARTVIIIRLRVNKNIILLLCKTDGRHSINYCY